ncbi:mRNA-degrading endonuclease [Algimonas ampicilliniresistens]|uniref:mRNA-degrading endonuclease n=1 Tax=Algimonas ampicilliniresistens TaxID=1298735 RepID=A0ABQ5VDE8_9PROT|nr:mRNA-degrading endonuclease [Algimonas ampicilliniresistens]
MAVYQPERGDLVFLNLDPRTGVELGKRRPALVLSPQNFNIATGTAVVCPITSTITESPFDVKLPRGARLDGCVVSNQMRSVDWIAREVDFHSKVDRQVMLEVLGRVEAILGLDLDPV